MTRGTKPAPARDTDEQHTDTYARDGSPRHDHADAGPDIGILITIRSLMPNLAPVERRVAQAVLDDPAGVAWRNISELARSCGTSATSVVRFCRAIGLRGYPELRLALAGAVAHDDESPRLAGMVT